MAQYPSTLLPQNNDPVEIQKGLLDLLKKVNETRDAIVPATSGTVSAIGQGIIESGSNANGSYIKFGDGTMECWGIKTAVANTTFTTVTLPKDYIDASYAPSIMLSSEAAAGNVISKDSTKNTSSFQAYQNCGSAQNITWRTIGKWK